VFPVRNRKGKNIGSVARRLDKESYMTWFNSPGSWALKALFPIHIIPRNTKRVAIVEGPFDAIRLNYMGIPAVALLGTGNWSELKGRMLQAHGVEWAILCMDGDKAGRKAEESIMVELNGMLKRKRYQLPIEDPALDPGNMSMEHVEALREFGKF